MTPIRLRNHFASDMTMISNEFIDNYMVSANGEYVKIYLYMLRLTLDSSASWTLSTITDKLECTSKDVLRALRYWMKKGLLSCEFAEDGNLTSVTFLDPETPDPEISASHATDALQTPTRAYLAPGTPAPEAARPLPYAKERVETITLAPERVKKIKRTKDAKLVLISAEGYMGHPLSPTEQDTILYFYDELHFSVDLMDYLLEHCAAQNACTLAYIKKVGFAWFDQGITTIEQAKEESRSHGSHSKDYFSFMRAYGLNNREPAATELTYFEKWLEKDKFSPELVLEAVNRTMAQIHAPKFGYTDSILEAWKKAGASTLSDIRILDEAHTKQQESEKLARAAGRVSSGRKTAFTDFESRKIDYDSLEKQLLGY